MSEPKKPQPKLDHLKRSPFRAAVVREMKRAKLTPYAVSQRARPKLAPSVVNRFVKAERSLSFESFEAICLGLGLAVTRVPAPDSEGG
jgi:hypothetical protein